MVRVLEEEGVGWNGLRKHLMTKIIRQVDVNQTVNVCYVTYVFKSRFFSSNPWLYNNQILSSNKYSFKYYPIDT